jgi:hypothetical protein
MSCKIWDRFIYFDYEEIHIQESVGMGPAFFEKAGVEK